MMRVGWVDGEAVIGHVAAVEIGWWRRDADIGIGHFTIGDRGRIGDDHLLGGRLRLRLSGTGLRLGPGIDALVSTQLVGISLIVRDAAGPESVTVFAGKLPRLANLLHVLDVRRV